MQRRFCCSVADGSRYGVITARVDAAEVQQLGEYAIINDAKRRWGRLTGASVSMNHDKLQVLVLEEIKEPSQ